MKKAVLIVVLLTVPVAGAGIAYLVWRSWESEAQAEHLTLFGNIDIRDARLAFNGDEHIAAVLVEEGDRVEPGQVLARLRTDRLDAEIASARARIAAQEQVVRRLVNGTRPEEIAQARAEVAAAQARAANARRIAERLRRTTEMNATSIEALDNARAQLAAEEGNLQVQQAALDLALAGPRVEDIDQARATLQALRADLTLLERRLADYTLTAPSSGIIQARLLEPGEYATPARPVFTLALDDPKWVRAYVPEPEMGQLAEGMPAAVFTDSYPGRTFDGWVGFISPTAEFTPKAVQTTDLRTKLVYEVRVFVHDPEHRLRLGQPVTVRVDTASPRLNPRSGKPTTKGE